MLKVTHLVRNAPSKGFMPMAAVLGSVVLIVAAVLLWVDSDETGQLQLDLALEQLEADVHRDPLNPNSRLAVAIAYAARGYYENAVTQFQETLKLDDQNQTALMGLGRVYLELGEHDDAIEPLLTVVEMNADNPFRGTIEQLETVYYDLGIIFTKKKDYAQATQYLQEALTINTVDADAWYRLGESQRLSGDLEQAAESYHRAVRLAPDYLEAYESMVELFDVSGLSAQQGYAKGMVDLVSHEYPSAIDHLAKATGMLPDLAEAHQGLAMALESAGRKQEALKSYEQALELDQTLLLAQLAVRRLTSQ